MAKRKSSSSGSSSIQLPTSVYAAFGLIVIGFVACLFWTKLTSPQITVNSSTVTEQLTKCQDLVTAKLEYTGLVTYEEGHISFIDKKGFTMTYNADVNAGVSLGDAKVDVEGTDINIQLPKATLKSISIDPDSLKFYDQKFALFNWQNREDTQSALKIAKKDAESKVNDSKLLEQADEQAKTAVEALFSPLTGEGAYKLTVTTEGETAATTADTGTEGTSSSEQSGTTSESEQSVATITEDSSTSAQ